MSENDDIRIDYFHSTFPGHVESIFRKGFRKKGHIDEKGYESNKSYMGCLGWGVYISPRMSVSLLFGQALIRVNLKKGTRILDITIEPEEKELRSLKRKYGKALFSSDAPLRKILPRNKQLTLKELVALTRYHYCRIWVMVADDPLDKYTSDPENNQFKSIEEAKVLFRKYGSAEHKELVERCNRRLTGPLNQKLKDIASIIGAEPE